MGIEPIQTACEAVSPALVHAPPSSDPGWTRTIVAWVWARSRGRWTTGSYLSGQGGSRTHRITRLSTWSLCLFAYLAMEAAGPRPKPEDGPLVELQAPVSIRASRPYESRPGTCPACKKVTKGRVELPCPVGHDVLSVACLPFHHLASRAARLGIEPILPARGAGLRPGGLASARPTHQRLVWGLNPSAPARQAGRDTSRVTRHRPASAGERGLTP